MIAPLVALLLVTAIGQSQGTATPPTRIVKGQLVRWTIQGLAGDMVIEEPTRRLQPCRVTAATYITRQTLRVTPAGVRPGDLIEMVGDFTAGDGSCVAVTLYVRTPERRLPHSAPILPFSSGFLDNLWPRGSLTFSGIVKKREGGRLIIWTRDRGEKSLAVRDDTTFRAAGRVVEPGFLDPQTRVYVRAGVSFEGDLEAYQIIWGEILNPAR